MKKYTRIKIIGIGMLVLAGLLNAGCETKDDQKISDAQACLDKARSPDDGSLCAAMVDGMVSAKASLIRCSALFLQRGFTTSTFTNAFQNLKNAPAGQDPMLSMISYIAFTGTSANSVTGRTNTQDADYALAECALSGSGGLVWLAAATKMATVIYNVNTAITVGNPSDFASNLSGASNADLGAAAIVAYNSYCAASSSTSTAACDQINQAVVAGGGDPAAVGAQIKTLLGTP